MTKQTKTFSLELKALNQREFTGQGSVFGNVDHGGDIVMPGAFRRSLSEHRKAGTMPLMFWMHDPSSVPGVWLEMDEDDDGLAVKGELVDTQLGNEMRTLLNKRAVRGLSIGYETRDADFDRDGNRLLKEVGLWEVSIVSMAMNPLANVEAVKSRLSSAGEYVPTIRELERTLRDAGCSRVVAKSMVARICDTDSSGMLESRRDAGGVVDDEERAALDAIEQLTSSYVRDAFRA